MGKAIAKEERERERGHVKIRSSFQGLGKNAACSKQRQEWSGFCRELAGWLPSYQPGAWENILIFSELNPSVMASIQAYFFLSLILFLAIQEPRYVLSILFLSSSDQPSIFHHQNTQPAWPIAAPLLILQLVCLKQADSACKDNLARQLKRIEQLKGKIPLSAILGGIASQLASCIHLFICVQAKLSSSKMKLLPFHQKGQCDSQVNLSEVSLFQ